MSRPPRSLRRGKCDAVPEGQVPPAGKLLQLRALPVALPQARDAAMMHPFDVRLIWILIILALVMPSLVGVRLLPSSW